MIVRLDASDRECFSLQGWDVFRDDPDSNQENWVFENFFVVEGGNDFLFAVIRFLNFTVTLLGMLIGSIFACHRIWKFDDESLDSRGLF